jgi:peptidoglycan/xylan/chitin deacetylase (PgdA/CDA1 family)
MRMGGYTAFRRLLPSRRVAILRYHAICDDGWYADPGICISPQAFEMHVRYLTANYSVLPLTEIVDRFRTRRPLPRNTVAITFDDGYADNLVAARTLNRYGVSATFFITAGCLAGGAPFWPAEIRALVPAVREPVLRLSLNGADVQIPVGNTLERGMAVKTISRLFKSHPIPIRESLREQLRRAADRPSTPECMLRWDELAEMHRLGMTVGAHTLTHPNLPSAGLLDAAAEIAGSKQRLELATGARITMFSYPNGGAECYYTPELQRIVRDAGFEAAATSRNGFASPESDPFTLERVQVHERLEDLVFALEIERFVFGPVG